MTKQLRASSAALVAVALTFVFGVPSAGTGHSTARGDEGASVDDSASFGFSRGLSLGPGARKYKRDELWAVDASSAQNAWAVGARFSPGPLHSLAIRWDGSDWVRVPTPDVGGLHDVAVVSEDEAWAIGGTGILHWDGFVWERTPHPRPDGTFFSSIDASGPDDAWVVGHRLGEQWIEAGARHAGYDTLTMHWDGSTWRVVPSPNPAPRHNSLDDVLTVSPIDAWASGGVSRERPYRNEALTLHWNGQRWSVVSAPNQGRSIGLSGLGTDRAGTVWAVGTSGGWRAPTKGLYMRWTGRAWELIPGPVSRILQMGPVAVSGATRSDAWAVGTVPNGFPLMARWDGTAWADATALTPAVRFPSFADVVALSPTDAWAVGHFQGKPGPDGFGDTLPLIERWDGERWRTMSVSPGD